jgi:hypothetical protein
MRYAARVREVVPADPTGRVKGAALAAFIRWYEDDRGKDELRARIGALPATLALELGLDENEGALGILASRWYDCRAIGVLLDAMVAGVEPRELERMIDASARAVMQHTLRGVYRMLFDWLATPERYARHSHRLWSSYHDTGSMTVEQREPTIAHCTIAGWAGHHPVMCAMCRASAEVIYTEMGCTGATTVRHACIADGAASCVFITRWG